MRTDDGQLPRRPRRPRRSAWARRWRWPREAGLRLGETGAIEVDRTQRSRSHPEVFAAGDCAQTYSRITGEALHVALGTHANKQGRVAGSVIGGRAARFAGVLGTALTKVGDLEIARTGLCTTQAEEAGYDYRTETIEGTTRAGYYPGAEAITVKLLSDRGSGLLLGAQIVGGPGSGKRIDVFATAIWAGHDRRGVRRLRPLLRAAVLADLRPGARRGAGGQPRRAGLMAERTAPADRDRGPRRRLVRRGPLRSGAHRGRVQRRRPVRDHRRRRRLHRVHVPRLHGSTCRGTPTPPS